MVLNPRQCRGRVEGAVAQGLGWALYEKMVIDETGTIVNPSLRNYRIPAFADIPRTEVYFAETHDTLGPLGAKGMGECPINPVAPALVNALANATGIRFRDLPVTPDRIYEPIFARHGLAPAATEPVAIARAEDCSADGGADGLGNPAVAAEQLTTLTGARPVG